MIKLILRSWRGRGPVCPTEASIDQLRVPLLPGLRCDHDNLPGPKLIDALVDLLGAFDDFVAVAAQIVVEARDGLVIVPSRSIHFLIIAAANLSLLLALLSPPSSLFSRPCPFILLYKLLSVAQVFHCVPLVLFRSVALPPDEVLNPRLTVPFQ